MIHKAIVAGLRVLCRGQAVWRRTFPSSTGPRIHVHRAFATKLAT